MPRSKRPEDVDPGVSEAASILGAMGASKGGQRRAEVVSPDRAREISAMGVAAKAAKKAASLANASEGEALKPEVIQVAATPEKKAGRKKKAKLPPLIDLFGDPIDPEPSKDDRALLPAQFERWKVRFLVRAGLTWWVARDVCRAAGIRNISQALSRLDEDEVDFIINNDIDGTPHKVQVISESGLFSLLLSGRTDECKRLKKWVTSEVLPSIRRTGSYSLMSARDLKVQRRARQLRCDEGTATVRVDVASNNIGHRDFYLSNGCSVAQLAEFYSTAHNALTGGDMAELRRALGQPSYATPLDRMGLVALTILSSAKTLLNQLIKDAGGMIPHEQCMSILRKTIEEHRDLFLSLLGPSYKLGVVSDGVRGLIYDVVRSVDSGQNPGRPTLASFKPEEN